MIYRRQAVTVMLKDIPRQLFCVSRSLLLATLSLTACAGPPRAAPGSMLGYGTPGVESYVPPEQGGSLDALLARCQGVTAPAALPPRPQTLEAACDQLHRTVRNQPGNAVQIAR